MTYQEKKDILTNNGVEELDLDEFIHEIKSIEASEINSQGLDAQLSFLFSTMGMTVKIIQERLQ